VPQQYVLYVVIVSKLTL